jgi:hypothetical protein
MLYGKIGLDRAGMETVHVGCISVRERQDC